MGKLVTGLLVVLICATAFAQKKEAAQQLSNLTLKVVDATTGKPVERFSIMCLRVLRENHGLIKGIRWRRYDDVHQDGVLLIEELHRGENLLLVLPEEESGYVPSGYQPVKVEEDGNEVTVRLRRATPFPVRVLDKAGKPASSVKVQLLQKLSKDADPTIVHRIRTKSNFRSSHWSSYLELAVAETGDKGTAQIPWQPWKQRSLLRVSGPGYVMTEVDAPVIRADMPPFVVRVSRAARLRGTVPANQLSAFAVDSLGDEVDVGHERLNPRIVLRNLKTGVLHEGIEGKAYRIGPKGSFLCDSVPPGRWQVLFRYNQPTRGGGGLWRTPPQSLKDVVLAGGKEQEVKLDLAPLMPTAVHGSVFLHGVVVQPESLGYEASWPNHRGEEKRFHALHFTRGFKREGGGYRLRGLPPGNYCFATSVHGADGKKRRFRTFEPVQLLASKERKLDLHFLHRVARIRLVRPDGETPVAGRVVCVGRSWDSVFVTDADGWFTVDPVRSLLLKVEVYGAGVDRKTLRGIRFDDPRARKWEVGKVELKKTARKVSEFRLVVPSGR